MKTAAFILLVPFAVFITETARFLPAMQESCRMAMSGKSACSKAKNGSPCSGKKTGTTCDKGKKDADKNCKDNPGCITCPVCYIFIYQPPYEWNAVIFPVKNSYGRLDTRFLSSYTPNVWKPPNGSFFQS